MTCRYNPEIHDATLIDLNQRLRRTDREIAVAMGLDPQVVTRNRIRLCLSAIHVTRPPNQPTSLPPPPPKERPNPIEVAARVLADRLIVKPGSGFWLDERPASTDTVVQAANAVLKRHGLEQVGPPKWRVE